MLAAAPSEYAKFLLGLLSIVNPIGAIPIFIELTQNQSPRERSRTGGIAAAAGCGVLLASLVSGEAILRFFGITIASFRVGGGILLLLMAISMLHARVSPAKQTEEEARDTAQKESVGVVPLGVPLLAGPGAISTVILYADRGGSVLHYGLLAAIIVVVAVACWLSFRTAPYLARLLGRLGINVVTRIMGLIMAAIGVEFIASGLRGLFPGLG